MFFFLLCFCFSLPSLAEIVYAKASFMHGEEISTKDGCEFAQKKAELNALQKGLNVTISSEETEKCSQIDGKSNCEQNQFFLKTFNPFFGNSRTFHLFFLLNKQTQSPYFW